MKWLLIYTAIATNNSSSNTLEFETKEICVERGIALLEIQRTMGLRIVAVCENPETGEKIEIKIPAGRRAA
jgi:hypothetical protein